MIIIINWAVYNRWFLSKGLFWKEKKVTFLHLGFLVCADRQGRVRNLFWFCLVSPGRGGASSCTPGTPEPPPPPTMWPEGQTAFRTPPRRRRAVTRWHALCSQDCFLLSSGPSPARPPCRSSPLLSPHPSLPSENPASWVVAWTERSGGGRPQQDGYDLGHGNCDPRVLVPWPWLASSSSCVWAP